MEEASPRLRLETLQPCCHAWSWESPHPRNHHAKWTWSPSLFLPHICWSLTRASYWQMPTGRKRGKCSLQTPSPKKAQQCGRAGMSLEDRREINARLHYEGLGSSSSECWSWSWTPRSALYTSVTEEALGRLLPQPPWKDWKYSPQKPTCKTERCRFTVL